MAEITREIVAEFFKKQMVLNGEMQETITTLAEALKLKAEERAEATAEERAEERAEDNAKVKV